VASQTRLEKSHAVRSGAAAASWDNSRSAGTGQTAPVLPFSAQTTQFQQFIRFYWPGNAFINAIIGVIIPFIREIIAFIRERIAFTCELTAANGRIIAFSCALNGFTRERIAFISHIMAVSGAIKAFRVEMNAFINAITGCRFGSAFFVLRRAIGVTEE
jgi:hypothetical protein